ncbi:2710_t:CDS:1 [Scutellospora calospora]|uniref:2710_t:CDS:1 n=1 Tax=Scutellospora calospora TaxID=85575 RepID=A0ACA9KBI3_9GLOM|nr:2710_t:CDS:1 [Scutellospora calospora]
MIPYETLKIIFDYLDYNDLKSFSLTCRVIKEAYIRYMYPNPKRDVFVSENILSPTIFRFNTLILTKKFKIPDFVIFDKDLLPCDHCGSSVCCSIEKPCTRCVSSKKKCTYGNVRNPKKRITFKDNRYYCTSPFNISQKLVCIKKENIGKSICEKCKKLKKCWYNNVFNNCSVPNCNLQRNSDTINTLQHWSIYHLHNLCQPCFKTFPDHFDVRFEKNSIWLGD